MKNILLIPAALILILSTSCKKKRTCSCTTTTTTVTTYPNGLSYTDSNSQTTTITAEKQTKKYFRMDNSCYDYTVKSVENNGYKEERTSTFSCTLK